MMKDNILLSPSQCYDGESREIRKQYLMFEPVVFARPGNSQGDI